MSDKTIDTLDELVDEFRQDPEYRKAERKLRPNRDIVLQINNRRNDLGITQKELAVIANSHQSRISKIERGEHDLRLSTLVEIAEALGCEISIQLVPFDEPLDLDYIPLFKNLILAAKETSHTEISAKIEQISISL